MDYKEKRYNDAAMRFEALQRSKQCRNEDGTVSKLAMEVTRDFLTAAFDYIKEQRDNGNKGE